ncbi:MAG TPA: response regulator transcription factor [Tepidiformaceae bacterium]|nr:response regulator transcription factor [Tepidiformaceae bacterium]HMO97111.1 response regulator transcription factor [Tepidiformaceae bacterium]
MNTINVVVIDDQDLVRAGFVALLRATPGFAVLGEAANGQSGLELIRSTHPDVALIDIRMPVMNGLEVIEAMRVDPACSRTRSVVLTTFGLDEYLFGALSAGASGFLLKDAPPAEFLRCIRVVVEGEALVSPSMTRRLIQSVIRVGPRVPVAPPPGLTDREKDILGLVCDGLSNAEIAERLVIGQATVKTYVSRLLAKFDVRTRVELVIAALQQAEQRNER